MKPSELRELSMEELKDKVRNLQEELFNLRFQHGTNQLENPKRMEHTKKDIARVKTMIRQKELSEAGK